jgi:hypothetical protein
MMQADGKADYDDVLALAAVRDTPLASYAEVPGHGD